MDHWPWDKKQPNYSAGFGQKISFRWLQAGWDGRTDGGAGGLRGIGWLVAAAVLSNCILIGSWVSHPPGISPTKLCHQCTLYNCQPSVHAQRVKKSSWQGISRSAPHAIFSLASAVSANACLFVHWHGANYNIIISAKLPLCAIYSIATLLLLLAWSRALTYYPNLTLPLAYYHSSQLSAVSCHPFHHDHKERQLLIFTRPYFSLLQSAGVQTQRA